MSSANLDELLSFWHFERLGLMELNGAEPVGGCFDSAVEISGDGGRAAGPDRPRVQAE